MVDSTSIPGLDLYLQQAALNPVAAHRIWYELLYSIQSVLAGGMSAVASTGTVSIASGNASDTNTITIGDGVHTASIFEFDSGVAASGTAALATAGTDGETITINDSRRLWTFELDDGYARGTLALATTGGVATNPDDGTTITISDGTHTASVFEFDSGTYSTGSATIAVGNVSDADTITINDGTHTVVFEFDTGVRAAGTITLGTNPTDGDTVTVGDGTLTKIFEFDVGVKATGSMALGSNDLEGATVALNDGAGHTATFEFDSGAYATGSVTFGAQPVDADKITIGDGGTPVVFEFYTTGPYVGVNTGVHIGASAAATMDNLIAAIITSALTFDAAPGTGDSCTVTAQTVGTAANVTITKSWATPANCTLVGMAGGLAAGTAITGGNVGVAIAGSASLTADNFVTALTGTAVTIVGVNTTGTVALTHAAYASSGNVAITKTGTKSTNITLAGMTGGLNPGTAITGGNVGVAIGGTSTISCTSLIAAINGSGLSIVATPTGTPDNVAHLLHNLYSTVGNVNITDTAGARITETGMSGGLVPGTDVTGGRTGVAIGTTNLVTGENFLAAVNGITAGLTVSATYGATHNIVNLTADAVGTAANGGLTKSGTNITVVNLAGGLAAGADVSGTNVGVAIGATAVNTMANLVTAINNVGGTLTVTATAAGSPDHTCTLKADTADATHNVTITHTVTQLQHTGMSGGHTGGSEVTSGNVGVAIGASATATMTNLVAAIAGTKCWVQATDGGDGSCTLAQSVVGTLGNHDITTSGADWTVTGMSGGLDAGSAVTSGHVGVAIGATNVLSMTNLATAINGLASTVLAVTAVDGGDGTAELTNDTRGTAGNITVSRSGGNITVTGLTGGLDAVSFRDILPGTSNLTFHSVAIAQGSTAGTTHLLAGVTGKYMRLHKLVGTVSAAGTLQIKDTADSPVALTGAMALAANAGLVDSDANPNFCPLPSTVSKGIDLITVGTGCGFNGYAILSTGSA